MLKVTFCESEIRHFCKKIFAKMLKGQFGKRCIKTANINAKNLQFLNAVNGAIVTPQKQQI
jgi:hypothetical protein